MTSIPAKSPGLAAVLGFFFGPLGLLYVGLMPALLMLGVNLVVGFITLGVGLAFTWPVPCALVGYFRAKNHNRQAPSRA